MVPPFDDMLHKDPIIQRFARDFVSEYNLKPMGEIELMPGKMLRYYDPIFVQHMMRHIINVEEKQLKNDDRLMRRLQGIKKQMERIL